MQTASEVVREALRLLKERDQAREQLRSDVQAGFHQLARGEGRAYDKSSGRQLAEQDLEEIWSFVAEDASPAGRDVFESFPPTMNTSGHRTRHRLRR